MKHYKGNSSVIFTDASGRQIDTFVIFDTEPHTGLTHINHDNLKVAAERLQLHAKSACEHHMPIQDAFSFEMIRKLRDKYEVVDAMKKVTVSKLPKMFVLAKAS
jgi:hypothetical protein